jgi:hypothetical protein
LATVADKVHYEELLPHEFEERLAHRPVWYVPIGTPEWHGVQNGLGTDFIQARGVLERAATPFRGIAFPPLWLGPDRISGDGSGPGLIGVDAADLTTPNRQLPGSCYWVPKGLFLSVVEAVLAQAKRAGFLADDFHCALDAVSGEDLCDPFRGVVALGNSAVLHVKPEEHVLPGHQRSP